MHDSRYTGRGYYRLTDPSRSDVRPQSTGRVLAEKVCCLYSVQEPITCSKSPARGAGCVQPSRARERAQKKITHCYFKFLYQGLFLYLIHKLLCLTTCLAGACVSLGAAYWPAASGIPTRVPVFLWMRESAGVVVFGAITQVHSSVFFFVLERVQAASSSGLPSSSSLPFATWLRRPLTTPTAGRLVTVLSLCAPCPVTLVHRKTDPRQARNSVMLGRGAS